MTDWYGRGITVTPGGSQTFSRMHGKMGPRTFPKIATRAEGAYIWDVDGNRYIDLAGANASAPLGFNHPRVVQAVRDELGRGGTLSLPTQIEVEASEAMINEVPVGDMVRWVRTGSEAVSGAIRTARHVTGKELVIVFDGSYHGWHPWTDCHHTKASVEPEEVDDAGLEFVDAAAVLVEPPRMAPITTEYIDWLRTLRRECTDHGVALIYDDVVFGFRFNKMGLLGATGVSPDLACFSKALGNGVPVGCFVGREEWMKDTPVSSTFGGETTGLAAAKAVLEIHREQDVCANLRAIGTKLRNALQIALDGSCVALEGMPVHFRFNAEPAALDLFLTACVERGVLIHRAANNASLALTQAIRNDICGVVHVAAKEAGVIHDRK
jgi:glutamate-1-semialdehyde aminotransferase